MSHYEAKWDFEELLRLSREAGDSMRAEQQGGRVQQAASVLRAAPFPSAALANTALVTLQIVAQEARKMHQTAEEEQTKRAAIEAQRQAVLAKIEATRVLLSEYMARTFDERGATLDRMFDALDTAQASGDTGTVQHLLGSIVDVVKASPFKDLAEFKRSYEDPEFVLEI